MEEELHVMLGRMCFNLRSTIIRDIGGMFIMAYKAKLFCQRYSLEQIITHATCTICISSTLIDLILTNSRGKNHKVVL